MGNAKPAAAPVTRKQNGPEGSAQQYCLAAVEDSGTRCFRRGGRVQGRVLGR